MNKRDLKADLELCNRASGESWKQASDIGYPYTIMDETFENVMAVYCTGDDAQFIAQAREGWPHAIGRAIEAEAKLEKAKGLIQRWFDGEISAFGVMDAMIIDLEFDIDGIPEEVLEYHNIKHKEVLGDGDHQRQGG